MRADEQAVKLDVSHRSPRRSRSSSLVSLSHPLVRVSLLICGKECESCQRERTTLEEYDEDGRLPMSHAVNARVNCCCSWCSACVAVRCDCAHAASPTADEATAMEGRPSGPPPSQEFSGALPLRRSRRIVGLPPPFCNEPRSPRHHRTAGSAALVALMWIGVSRLRVACSVLCTPCVGRGQRALVY